MADDDYNHQNDYGSRTLPNDNSIIIIKKLLKVKKRKEKKNMPMDKSTSYKKIIVIKKKIDNRSCHSSFTMCCAG